MEPATNVTLTVPVLDLKPQELDLIVEDLRAFHAIFSPLFQREEQRMWSEIYLHGLLLELPRKSIEPMILHLQGANATAVRGLQQFISISPWQDTLLLRRLWQEVAQDIGEAEGILILDGSDFPKQGQHSVGVQRQYCGELGKKANCQAGVFVAYASTRGYTLLDRRLYLPGKWFGADYAARRQACDVPKEITFATKSELGWDMLQAVRQADVLPCRWVLCDEAFGNTPTLLDQIASLDLWYFAEVPVNTHVWTERPATAVPLWSGRGPKPQHMHLLPDAPRPLSVRDLAQGLPDSAWQRHTIQEGSQGPQGADLAFVRVVAVRDGLPGPDVWLVLRRSLTDGEVKYFLSNAPADVTHAQLVRLSGLRWPIELCFEVGKQELGMGDYEVRSWRGWHHHMTLVLLAMAFLLRLQTRLKKSPCPDLAPGSLSDGTLDPSCPL